jgi:hypothetical protein
VFHVAAACVLWGSRIVGSVSQLQVWRACGVQVGVKQGFQGPSGQLQLFFGNKADVPLGRLICAVPPQPVFAFQLGAVPPYIEPKKQVLLRPALRRRHAAETLHWHAARGAGLCRPMSAGWKRMSTIRGPSGRSGT